LTAAAYSLGIAHPPGFPLYVFAGRLFIILELGNPALMMNLFSAICSTIAVTLSIYVYQEFYERQLSPGAFLSALLFAFGGMLWMQAVRAEVYTIAILALEITLFLSLKYIKQKDSRYLFGAGYFWSLGFTLHTAMGTAVLLPLIGILLFHERKFKINPSDFGYGIIGILVGLSVFLYLPIRAALNPLIKWGNPESFSGLFNMITTKEFSFTIDAKGIENIGHKLNYLFTTINENFPLIIIPLIILGIIQKKQLFLILVVVLTVLTVLIRKGLPHTDYSGYLLPLTLALSLFAGRGLDLLIEILKKIRYYRDSVLLSRLIPVILILFLCLPISAAQYQRKNLSGNFWAEKMGRDILEHLPDSSIVLFDDISSYFICQSLQAIERLRSDCDLVQIYALNENSKSRDWYLKQLKNRTQIAGLSELPGNETEIIGRIIEENYGSRRIFCEYGEAFRPLCHYIKPYGLVYEIILSDSNNSSDIWEYDYPNTGDFGYDRTAAIAFAERIYAKSLYLNDIGEVESACNFYIMANEMENRIK